MFCKEKCNFNIYINILLERNPVPPSCVLRPACPWALASEGAQERPPLPPAPVPGSAEQESSTQHRSCPPWTWLFSPELHAAPGLAQKGRAITHRPLSALHASRGLQCQEPGPEGTLQRARANVPLTSPAAGPRAQRRRADQPLRPFHGRGSAFSLVPPSPGLTGRAGGEPGLTPLAGLGEGRHWLIKHQPCLCPT